VGVGYGTDHSTEVLRKQYIPLEMLGFVKTESAKGSVVTEGEDGGYFMTVSSNEQRYTNIRILYDEVLPSVPSTARRFFVGCGDSNAHMIAGIDCTLINIKNCDVPNVLVADALSYGWNPDDIIFCDGYATHESCTKYYSRLNSSSTSNVSGSGEGVKAGTTLSEFQLTWCFAEYFMSKGVKYFSVKILLEPDASLIPKLVLLHNAYHCVWSMGGRGHNGEVFLTCHKRGGSSTVQYTELAMRLIVYRYLCYAVSCNIGRFISIRLMKLVVPPIASFIQPRTYDVSGKCASRYDIKLSELWPTIKLNAGSVASIAPSIPSGFNFDAREADVGTETVVTYVSETDEESGRATKKRVAVGDDRGSSSTFARAVSRPVLMIEDCSEAVI